MRISLRQIYIFLFLVGVFFIPFNSYQGISFLGEYRKDGAIIFFLLSFVLFFIDASFKMKIKIPRNNILFQALLLFVFWLIISTLLNINTVFSNYMKQTSGLTRFSRQLLALSIALVLFITTYNVFNKFSKKESFYLLRRVFLYSFIFVSLYSFFEILIVVFNVSYLKNIFSVFDYFPFTETSLDLIYHRISSVSYEPPFLAIYLITIAGWMFSYILTSKKNIKYLPTLIVFILTFFSGSRTALIVVLFQFIIFIWIVFSASKKFNKIIQRFLTVSSILAFLIFMFNREKITESIETKIETLDFKKNIKKSISNRSRFGIQYTSLLIFKENPILGVGFGQQGYHARDKYPKWVTKKNYEFNLYYLNNKEKSFPPGFNLYTRLLAETGIIGLLIFIFFIFLIFHQCKKLIKNKKKSDKVFPIVLLISFVGFSINWLQFDSFRVFGFWICLALLLQQANQKIIENE
jgi:O-antigen ligase